jgi:hypothetical protein
MLDMSWNPMPPAPTSPSTPGPAAQGAQRRAARLDDDVVDQDPARDRRHEPVHAAEQRGLSGARRAQQHDDLAALHGEADVAQGVGAAREDLADVIQRDHRPPVRRVRRTG